MKDFSIDCFERELHSFFKSDFQQFINAQKNIFDKNIKERYHKLISGIC